MHDYVIHGETSDEGSKVENSDVICLVFHPKSLRTKLDRAADANSHEIRRITMLMLRSYKDSN